MSKESEQATLFELPAPARPDNATNPCLALYGEGPQGVTCKTCMHCRAPQYRRNAYWKCDLRRLTHGPTTDHHTGWPACGRYIERKEPYHGG